MLLGLAAVLTTIAMVAAIPRFGGFVFVTLLILMLGVVSFVRPTFGLFVFTFLIYSRVTEVINKNFGVPAALPGIAPAFALLLLTALVVSFGPGVLQRLRLGDWVPFIVYGLVLMASALVASNVDRSIDTIYAYTRDIGFFAIMVLAIRRIFDMRVTIWAIILSAASPAIITMYQAITGSQNQFYGFGELVSQYVVQGEDAVLRPAGPVSDPNFYALALIPAVPLALFRFHHEQSRLLQAIALLSALVTSIAVLLTYSRGGFVTLGLVLVACVAVRLISLRAFVVALVVAALAIPFVPSTYVDRFAGLTELLPSGDATATTPDSSFEGRALEMQAGIEMFLENPILGVGANNYKQHFQDVGRELGIGTRAERSPHSLPVQILAETGVVGMLAFGALVGAALFWLWRVWRWSARRSEMSDLAIAAGVALLGFLVGSIFLHLAQPRYLWSLLAIALAIYMLAREARSPAPNLEAPVADLERADWARLGIHGAVLTVLVLLTVVIIASIT